MVPRPHLWICANKTACLAAELQVSLDPSPRVWFSCIQKNDFMTRINCLCLAQEYQDYMGSSPHLWFCVSKTSTLEPASVGPRPHLLFLHAKQRILDQNIKSLRVPDMTYHLVHVQERA